MRTIAGAIFGVILASALPMLDRGEVEIDDLFTTIDRGLAQLKAGLALCAGLSAPRAAGTGR